MMTGIAWSSGLDFSSVSISKPPMMGMLTSRRMRSGSARSMAKRALKPLVASIKSQSKVLSAFWAMRRTALASSTTRILGCIGGVWSGESCRDLSVSRDEQECNGWGGRVYSNMSAARHNTNRSKFLHETACTYRRPSARGRSGVCKQTAYKMRKSFIAIGIKHLRHVDTIWPFGLVTYG